MAVGGGGEEDLVKALLEDIKNSIVVANDPVFTHFHGTTTSLSLFDFKNIGTPTQTFI